MQLQVVRARRDLRSAEEASHRQRAEMPADVSRVEARDAVESPAASHAIDVERTRRPCRFRGPRQTHEDLLKLLAGGVRIAHAEEDLRSLGDLAGDGKRA